jgi:hypothetical protein
LPKTSPVRISKRFDRELESRPGLESAVIAPQYSRDLLDVLSGYPDTVSGTLNPGKPELSSGSGGIEGFSLDRRWRFKLFFLRYFKYFLIIITKK